LFLTIAIILQLLEEHGEVIEQEKLPSIDDTSNQLEVAEYVDTIYKYYWILEVIVFLIQLDAINLEKNSVTGTPIFSAEHHSFLLLTTTLPNNTDKSCMFYSYFIFRSQSRIFLMVIRVILLVVLIQPETLILKKFPSLACLYFWLIQWMLIAYITLFSG
jgi:hypothetical protein